MDEALPVDVVTLQAMVRELSPGQEARDQTIAEHKRALRQTQQRIDWLLRRLFARATEKLGPTVLPALSATNPVPYAVDASGGVGRERRWTPKRRIGRSEQVCAYAPVSRAGGGANVGVR